MPRSRGYRSTSPRRSTPRTTKWWQGGFFNPFALGPGLVSLQDLTEDLPESTPFNIGRVGMTVLRSYITLRLNSTDANLSCEAAFGIAMISGEAMAGGVPPDVLTDIEYPWMAWENRAYLPASDSGQHMSLDIKAKRRFRGPDDTVAFVLENHDANETLEIALAWRILLQRT